MSVDQFLETTRNCGSLALGIACDVFISAHAKASIGRQALEDTSHRPDLEITKFGIGAELKYFGSLFLGIYLSRYT